MLLRKKKKPKTISTVKIFSDKNTVYDGPFRELPFDEKLIVDKSIQFYDDPDPCFIHTQAVRTRLLGEIEEELLPMAGDNTTLSIPGAKAAALCMYFPQAASYTVTFTLS